MKEIKFRAWDKARKEFLSSGSVLISVEAGNRPEKNPQYLDILTGPDCYKSRFVLQQYTGIKDKNGIEIFEGDVIRTMTPDLISVVTWDDNCARFIGFTLEHERRLVYIDMVDKNNKSSVEVVGNIYENPGLTGGRGMG